jgi:hypothetical protein
MFTDPILSGASVVPTTQVRYLSSVYRLQEIKESVVGVAPNCTTLIPNFVKIDHLVQKLKSARTSTHAHTHTHTHGTISQANTFKE